MHHYSIENEVLGMDGIDEVRRLFCVPRVYGSRAGQEGGPERSAAACRIRARAPYSTNHWLTSACPPGVRQFCRSSSWQRAPAPRRYGRKSGIPAACEANCAVRRARRRETCNRQRRTRRAQNFLRSREKRARARQNRIRGKLPASCACRGPPAWRTAPARRSTSQAGGRNVRRFHTRNRARANIFPPACAALSASWQSCLH